VYTGVVGFFWVGVAERAREEEEEEEGEEDNPNHHHEGSHM